MYRFNQNRICTAILWGLLIFVCLFETGPAEGVYMVNTGRLGTPISNLPCTLTQPGLYYVTSNLETTGSGISVQSPGVVIDLMGFTLTGSQEYEHGIVFETGAHRGEVRNGRICRFRKGVISSPNINGIRLFNLQISDNLIGIDLTGTGHVIEQCTIMDNTGPGIFVSGASSIIECVIINNVDMGVIADISPGQGYTIQGNIVSGNQGRGVHVYENSMIQGNVVQWSDESGIVASEYCKITGNILFRNNQDVAPDQAGILVYDHSLINQNCLHWNLYNSILAPGTYSVLESNMLTGSLVGIVFSGSHNFYKNNRASNFANYSNTGDDTDGGGNIGY
ncbi:MAG: hypothetical protein D3926_03785 [Desulfobacteraceae bacterium]|nr:MAG: hypothetical protein D3926_03785 [Desulfobacteraceae bacterium]